MTARGTWVILTVGESELELGPETSHSEGWVVTRDGQNFAVLNGRMVVAGANSGRSKYPRCDLRSKEEMLLDIEKLAGKVTITAETRTAILSWINR